jgi:hypothetical protein
MSAVFLQCGRIYYFWSYEQISDSKYSPFLKYFGKFDAKSIEEKNGIIDMMNDNIIAILSLVNKISENNASQNRQNSIDFDLLFLDRNFANTISISLIVMSEKYLLWKNNSARL